MEQKISIKAARVNANLTQTQAAEKIGVCKNTLIKYESGIRIPRWDIATRMAEVYKQSTDNINWEPKKQ